ncbi:MAG: cytochrome c maturation protein CcmE [Magnetococcales bacterium]|nr:cytochrome c maturation protein CcmE [Magnetococcales bacterium]
MVNEESNNRKNRRWLLIVSLLLVAGSLLTLVFTSFNDALVYFFTPTEIQAQSKDLEGRKIRIGGMVQEGSLTKVEGTQKIRFLITDGDSLVPVRYDGMLPDLFREGQGVVAEGVWRGGQDFPASQILAKHSEDYLPVEMTEEGISKAKSSILKSLK